MFAILFGLSMDYEVFLMTQIQEHYKEEGDAHKAVVDGLANTGRVITSAALIMVCVFSSFVLNGNADRQGVRRRVGGGDRDRRDDRALPAVPAIMALMGDRAWWLPKWLDRILPPISIEGGDYFERRDAERREQRPPSPSPPSRRVRSSRAPPDMPSASAPALARIASR